MPLLQVSLRAPILNQSDININLIGAFSNTEALHLALAVLRISAGNSLVSSAVPVRVGVCVIWSHFSVEVAAGRETKLLQDEHQVFLTTAFTRFVFVLCAIYYVPNTILSAFAV